MDDISALLRHLVQTKSIERSLAPIATQISQLVMVNETFECGETDTFPSDLVSRSTSVRDSAAQLVRVSKLMALETEDEVTKRDMTRASELLDVSADSLVTATHRVYVDNMSHSSRRHLIRAAKDLLEGTLKVLLVSDNAKVRKIVTCARCVLGHLQDMTGVKTVAQLVVCFKSFTDALSELVTLLDKRQNNLIDPHQREHIIVAMTTLKKCVPMLKSSMQTFVKHPHNPQVLASQEYSVGQVIESLHAIIDLVEGRKPVEDIHEGLVDMSGHFVTIIDKLTTQLSEKHRQKSGSTIGELDSLIEGAVSHSMAIAHLSTGHHRDLIRQNCQRVFRQLSRITELHKNVTSSPEFTQLQLDFGEACDCLIEELWDLERHSSAAVLHLVVDVLKETTEPLYRLLRAALSTSQLYDTLNVTDREVRSDRKVKHVTEQRIEPLIDSFQQHAELVCQVSRLVAAGSRHSKNVRTINGCVNQLEQLDPEVVPVILTVCHHGDSATLEDVRLLTQEWTNNVELLVTTIDGTIDAQSFIGILAKQIQREVSEWHTSALCGGSTVSTDSIRCILGHSRRLSQVASEVVHKHENPFCRRTLRTAVHQLNKAIVTVKSVSVMVNDTDGDTADCQQMFEPCEQLVSCVVNVRKASLRQTNHHVQHVVGHLPSLDWDLSEKEGDIRDHLPSKLCAVEGKRKESEETRRETGQQDVTLGFYLPEFTSDQLTVFVSQLTTAAVGGEQRTVDLLCMDILTMTNHMTQTAVSVSEALQDRHRQRTLQCLSSQVTQLAPQLLDSAACVVQRDVTQVEPLHVAAESWAKKVTQLEILLDCQLRTWRREADRVMDAVKTMNATLLTSQAELLQDHQRFLHKLVDTTIHLLDLSYASVVTPNCHMSTSDKANLAKQRHQLQAEVTCFHQLTSTFLTVADMLVDKDAVKETVQLELTAREWAAAVFCLTAHISTLSHDTCLKLNVRSPPGDSTECSALLRELDAITQVTITVKELVNSVLESQVSPESVSELTTLLDQLDDHNVQMSDCLKLITHVSTPYQMTEKLFAPYSLRLLQWTWAAKVRHVYDKVEQLTTSYSQKVLSSPDKDIDSFQEQLTALCDQAQDVVRHCHDTNRAAVLQRHLQNMMRINSEILYLVEDSTQNESDQTSEGRRREFLELRWAVNSCAFMANLRDVSKPDSQIILDAEKLLEHGDSKRLDAADRTGQSEHVQSPDDHSHDANTQQKGHLDQYTLTHDRVTQDMVTQDTVTQDTHNSAGYYSQLTGSLLELADDLGVTSVMYCGDVARSLCHETISSDLAGETTCREKSAAETTSVQHSTPSQRGTTNLIAPIKWGSVDHTRPAQRGTTDTHTGCSPSGWASVDFSHWEDDDNALVNVAKVISQQLGDMVDYMHGHGSLKSKSELIVTANAVIGNGEKLVEFAKILAKYCVSERLSTDLLNYCDQVPVIMTQLHILAGVKMATTDNMTRERTLRKAADNLVVAINRMLRVAESSCIKGLREPPKDRDRDREAVSLARQWKWRLDCHRRWEVSTTDTNELGLRKMTQRTPPPTLSHISHTGVDKHDVSHMVTSSLLT